MVCKKCKTEKATKKCSRCKIVKYCSIECQRADWSEHKETCHPKPKHIMTKPEAMDMIQTINKRAEGMGSLEEVERLASEENDPEMQIFCGRYYQSEPGADFKRAFDYFQKAYENKHVLAFQLLAEMYEHGLGTQADPEMACKLYREGANAGNPFSLGGYGSCLERGLGGLKRDKEAALSYYLWAVNDAQVNTDIGSIAGLLGPDHPDFRMWLEKGEQLNDGSSIFLLANSYDMGTRGFVEDREKAVALYRRGAVQGHRQCLNVLSSSYRLGRGVERNNLVACQCLLAAAPFMPEARAQLPEFRAWFPRQMAKAQEMLQRTGKVDFDAEDPWADNTVYVQEKEDGTYRTAQVTSIAAANILFK